jgi:3-deoxy-manno-octulosonate cytidylyltransferase (CMP-KDO synthetase)
LIPFYRNSEQTDRQYLKHVGIYAYRTETLRQLSELQTSFLETAESLEQLRWIENGFNIRVIVFGFESPCVDVPQDIEVIEKILRKQTDK